MVGGDFAGNNPIISPRGVPDYIPFYELSVNTGIMERILGKEIPDRAANVEFFYKAGYDY